MKLQSTLLVAVLLLVSIGQPRAQDLFTKVTTGPIATDIGPFTGFAWVDLNSDGLLDLVAAQYDATNVFYMNSGGGSFSKFAAGAPDSEIDYHAGLIAGDYDNDGYADLLLSPGQGAPTARTNILYRNSGNGTFSRVSGGSLSSQPGFFRDNAWADYDNDGFLDVFVDNHGDSGDDGGKNFLFHNKGDGTFEKVTSGSVVNDSGVAFGVQWADFDNDGFMDLLVVNNPYNTGIGVNFLYHNERNGTFRRVLTNSVATDVWTLGADCGAWGDYDNDGLPDLFVTANGGSLNRLYHNDGSGNFKRISSGPMLAPPPGGYSVGCVWGDYDNDGYLDLFLSNGDGPNGLFHNNGDGTFAQVIDTAPVNAGGLGIECNTCSWVDYDNDGFLDLCFDSNLDNDYSQKTKNLFHNNGNSNAWLEVKCVGTASNRSAIGAKVRVKATIGGKTFWQLREINGGGGFNIVPLVAHFGLGDATNVTQMRIEWPSGTVQEFANLATKKLMTITEPARLSIVTTNGLPEFYLKGGRFMLYDIQRSTDLSAWGTIATVTITDLDGRYRIVDTNTPNLSERFYRAIGH